MKSAMRGCELSARRQSIGRGAARLLIALALGLLAWPAATAGPLSAAPLSAALQDASWGPAGSSPARPIARHVAFGGEVLSERRSAALRGSAQTIRALPGAAQLAGSGRRERGEERRGIGSADAFLTALMSALVPGAGQLRNGSILRGLGYLAVEIGSWAAYLSFRHGAEDRLDEVSRFADGYWDIDRYAERAQHPDSCSSCGCPDGEAYSRDLALIEEAQAGSRTRYLEYIGRDAYGCGWDTSGSAALYASLWDDREDMQGAQRWAGRLLFLNHLVSAVDAFFEARSIRLRMDDQTDLSFNVRGLPIDLRPEIRITRRF